MNRINRMNKAEVLQTLVKVAKLQEKLLNKLASDESPVSLESFEEMVDKEIIEKSHELTRELHVMERSDIKDAVDLIVSAVQRLFGNNDSALKAALAGLSEDQIVAVLEDTVFLRAKNLIIYNAENEVGQAASTKDLKDSLQELRELVILTLDQLTDLMAKKTDHKDMSKTLECHDCGHLNPLTAKKCVECDASLTKARIGEDTEGDELPVYNPRPADEDEDGEDEDGEDEEDEEDDYMMRR
jgi:hypothetical protein